MRNTVRRAFKAKERFNFLSNLVPQYQEIKPFTKDAATGEYLNESHYSIFKRIEDKNLQEVIDSHKDECDIYKILKTVAATGDTSILNQRSGGTYADISEMPSSAAELVQGQNDPILAERINQLEAYLKELQAASAVGSSADNVNETISEEVIDNVNG